MLLRAMQRLYRGENRTVLCMHSDTCDGGSLLFTAEEPEFVPLQDRTQSARRVFSGTDNREERCGLLSFASDTDPSFKTGRRVHRERASQGTCTCLF